MTGQKRKAYTSEALAALMSYEQADEEGVMVLVSRQAVHEVAGAHEALVDALEAAKELFELDPECGKPGTDAWAWLKQAEEVLDKARGQS